MFFNIKLSFQAYNNNKYYMIIFSKVTKIEKLIFGQNLKHLKNLTLIVDDFILYIKLLSTKDFIEACLFRA